MRKNELTAEWSRYYAYGQKARDDEIRSVQQHHEKPWGVYDSKLLSYEVTFRRVMQQAYLPEHVELIKLQQQHELGTSTFIGLELMGPGSNLFGAFPEGLFTHTAGVTLYDHRTDEQKAHDLARNHSVYAMNVLEEYPVYDAFRREWIGDDYVDFLICRPYFGGKGLPPHPLNQYQLYNNFYQLLRKGGEALIQYSEEHMDTLVDSSFLDVLPAWQEYVLDNFDIEISIDPGRRALRLWKGYEAPDTLPALPTKKTLQLMR